MSWVLASIVYGLVGLASLVVVWRYIHRTHPVSSVSVEIVARDVAELRSLFLETVADTAESQRRVEFDVRDAKTTLAEIEQRLQPVEVNVGYLRRHTEEAQLEAWFAAPTLPSGSGSTD